MRKILQLPAIRRGAGSCRHPKIFCNLPVANQSQRMVEGTGPSGLVEARKLLRRFVGRARFAHTRMCGSLFRAVRIHQSELGKAARAALQLCKPWRSRVQVVAARLVNHRLIVALCTVLCAGSAPHLLHRDPVRARLPCRKGGVEI